MPLPEKQLRVRDAKRDLGAELLASVREMKAGQGAVLGGFPTSKKRPVTQDKTYTSRHRLRHCVIGACVIGVKSFIDVSLHASLGSSLLLMYPSASGQ